MISRDHSASIISLYDLDDFGCGVRIFGSRHFRGSTLGNLSAHLCRYELKGKKKKKKKKEEPEEGGKKMAARSGGRFRAKVSADRVRADQASRERRIVFFIIPDGLRDDRL